MNEEMHIYNVKLSCSAIVSPSLTSTNSLVDPLVLHFIEKKGVFVFNPEKKGDNGYGR